MPEGRAVRISEPGGPEVLTLGELRVREPGAGEVLVEVAAAGLNRADTLQRRGFYPAPPGVPSDVPGLEYAGTVAALGHGVTSSSVGDRVMGITAGGGMSEFLVAHSREILPIPEGMSFTDAAAVPEVFMTAYDAVIVQGGLGLGQTLLVHAAASGVGTAAIQLARAVGARPIGTSRTEEKLERCAQLGLEQGIVAADGRFADALKAMAPGGAHVILDTVGAAYLEDNLAAVAVGGTIVVIGLMGGIKGEVNLGLLLRRRAHIVGSVLRSRPLEEKAALAQDFAQAVLPLLRDGRLEPIVDEVLPMTDVVEAHRRMEANETFGKLVLAWDV